jgi:hypothetical protein
VRWPAAILDRVSVRRRMDIRPGRRNGPQPNQETGHQSNVRLADARIRDEMARKSKTGETIATGTEQREG